MTDAELIAKIDYRCKLWGDYLDCDTNGEYSFADLIFRSREQLLAEIIAELIDRRQPTMVGRRMFALVEPDLAHYVELDPITLLPHDFDAYNNAAGDEMYVCDAIAAVPV